MYRFLQNAVNLCQQHRFDKIEVKNHLLQFCGWYADSGVENLGVLSEFLSICEALKHNYEGHRNPVTIRSSTGLHGYLFEYQRIRAIMPSTVNFTGNIKFDEISPAELQKAFATCELVNFRRINLSPAAIANVQRAWEQLDKKKHRPRLIFKNVTADEVLLAQLVKATTPSRASAVFFISVNDTTTIYRENLPRHTIEINSSASGSRIKAILETLPMGADFDVTTKGSSFATFSPACCKHLHLHDLHIDKQFFNGDAITQWQTLLRQPHEHLAEVRLSNPSYVAPEQKSAMISALITSQLDSLSSLDLINAELNDADLVTLTPWLAAHKNLQTINLSGNNFSGQALNTFMQAVHTSPTIHTITLSDADEKEVCIPLGYMKSENLSSFPGLKIKEAIEAMKSMNLKFAALTDLYHQFALTTIKELEAWDWKKSNTSITGNKLTDFMDGLIKVIDYIKNTSGVEKLELVTCHAISLLGKKVLFNADPDFIPQWYGYGMFSGSNSSKENRANETEPLSVNPFYLSTLLNYLARCFPGDPQIRQWPIIAARYYMYTQGRYGWKPEIKEDGTKNPSWIKLANKVADQSTAFTFWDGQFSVSSHRTFREVMRANDLKTCHDAIKAFSGNENIDNSDLLADLDLTIKAFKDHDARHAAENSKSSSSSSMLSAANAAEKSAAIVGKVPSAPPLDNKTQSSSSSSMLSAASAAEKSAAAAGKVPSAPPLENKAQSSSTSTSSTSSTTLGSRVVGFINSIFSPEPSAPPAETNYLANVDYPPQVLPTESSATSAVAISAALLAVPPIRAAVTSTSVVATKLNSINDDGSDDDNDKQLVNSRAASSSPPEANIVPPPGSPPRPESPLPFATSFFLVAPSAPLDDPDEADPVAVAEGEKLAECN